MVYFVNYLQDIKKLPPNSFLSGSSLSISFDIILYFTNLTFSSFCKTSFKRPYEADSQRKKFCRYHLIIQKRIQLIFTTLISPWLPYPALSCGAY